MSTTTTHIDTEKQLVPELRFKEFEGDWDKKKIRDVLTIGSGKDYKHLKPGNIPVYGTGGLMAKVDTPIHTGKTVFIGRKGSIDKPFYYDGDFWTVDTLFYTHSFQETDPYFVYGLFQKINWYKHNEASGVPSLSKTTIGSLVVNLPSLPEQQKIASFLSTVDEKIQQLSKKKALLEDYKKGGLQQLFSGQLRFKDQNGNSYPDWEEKLLGKLIEICSSKRVLQEDWKDEGVPFLRTREIINLSNNVGFKTPIFITDELFEELKNKYGVPKSGDILATGVGTIGQLYIVNQTDKFYFKDGNVLWFKMNDSLDSDYLNQLFKTRFIRKQLSDNASITTVATFTIDGARKTKIIYPCRAEQQKIATYLSIIDAKIESVNHQITQTKTFKKGLLQQLFI